jgi:hypothetical protein
MQGAPPESKRSENENKRYQDVEKDRTRDPALFPKTPCNKTSVNNPQPWNGVESQVKQQECGCLQEVGILFGSMVRTENIQAQPSEVELLYEWRQKKNSEQVNGATC